MLPSALEKMSSKASISFLLPDRSMLEMRSSAHISMQYYNPAISSLSSKTTLYSHPSWKYLGANKCLSTLLPVQLTVLMIWMSTLHIVSNDKHILFAPRVAALPQEKQHDREDSQVGEKWMLTTFSLCRMKTLHLIFDSWKFKLMSCLKLF